MEKRILITLGNLKTQHTLSKENSLNEYKNCPRFRSDDQEELSWVDLERRIDDKCLSYEERTIQRKIKNAVASGVPITILSGLVAGTVGLPSRLFAGTLLGFSLTYGYLTRQNRR